MPHQIGYCTNVHAGANFAQMRQNLQEYALAVKARFRPDSEMGIGLWLSANSAKQLLADDRVADFGDWLADHQLVPFTLNGFPYGDFHEPVVKHRVYQPTWCETERLEYTMDLVTILDQLLPPGVEGSISTLPICWGTPPPVPESLRRAANQLRQVAHRLARLESSGGRLMHVCIEPEPGCYLQRSEDIVRFFEEYLLTGGEEELIRRHIRVCHDVCHAAVMFQSQSEVLDEFRDAGILVGKIQVSSAVVVDFRRIDPQRRVEAVRQLSGFAEDRYLHQTTARKPSGEERFFEDLPLALQSIGDPRDLQDQWCVHFHVPVYLDRFGLLETSRQQIKQCLAAVARSHPQLTHFEVETYAWGVLPEPLKQPDLASGIVEELEWFAGQLQVASATADGAGRA